MKMYSLRKSKHVLRQAAALLQRKHKSLSAESAHQIRLQLIDLQERILNKEKERASLLAQQIELLGSSLLKKSRWDHTRELGIALCFALVVAVVVRQMWFEFYEIPSGSMRPTFKEQDRLAVSKTTFGINIPLTPREFYFDPALVERNGIVIFTGENMDIPDVNTLYFYLFPGKKQYVKRLIGKPGDILYFYGGQIYGIDAQGRDISSELNLERLSHIDHIPFIDFERKVVTPPHPIGNVYSPLFLYQMNRPVAKLSVNASRKIQGEMLPLTGIHDPTAPAVPSYGALWGFHHFATARLLTAEQARKTPSDALLYLELKHHPDLATALMVQDERGRLRPTIGLSTTLLPLGETQLRTLLSHLYTARFYVQDGHAYRQGSHKASRLAPKLPDVPNGCYEFYEGKAYEVLWQGITKELPSSHPLYRFDVAQIQLLFNAGMEWDTRFLPSFGTHALSPARYAYFRKGDFYVMGAPLLDADDPLLKAFTAQEQAHHAALSSYPPFVDLGPPLLEDGSLNRALIEQNGLLVPPGSYLVLGDNHAMSADSREFGFVPAENLRGAPDLIFWPPGTRWGHPNQPPYPFFNGPRSVIWILAAAAIGGSFIYYRRKQALPLRSLRTKEE